MLRLSIDTNADQVAKQVERFADQIPFAMALALTNTAKEAQGYLRDHLDDHFTVRGNWVRNSIRYRPANKRDVNPVAYVGSVYAPMALQAEGGKKRGDIAVPMWARRDESKKTAPSTWPGAVSKRKNFFVGPFGKRGVGDEAEPGAPVGVFQRVGRGKAATFRLWWVLRNAVTIKAAWPAAAEVSGVVRSEFPAHFWAAMEYAAATRR